MNFKDAYKSYNDEIKGDPKVLEAILEGKKENKNVSKKLFVIRPSLVGAMAAMVIIAVSVFGLNNFGNKNSEPQKTYIASRKADTAKDIPGAEFKVASGEAANNDPVAESSFVPKQNNPQESLGTDNTHYEPLAETEVLPATVSHDEVGQMPMVARSVSSDGDIEAYNTDTITTQDCYSFFGFCVTDVAKLPQDMTFGGNVIINGKKSDDTGKMEYCSFSIDACSQNDPQRVLEVCVTKQLSPMDNAGSSEYFTHEETGEISGGKLVTDNMSILVNSQNVTKAEVEILIESLKIK